MAQDAFPKVCLAALLALALGCTTSGAQGDAAGDGSGGAAAMGSGGADPSPGSGGIPGAGASGGAPATGGKTGSGGVKGSGGSGGITTGGSGGVTTGGSGGAKGSGGLSGGGAGGTSTGGMKGSGGVKGSGGASASGGVTGTGGQANMGGHAGASSGGATGSGSGGTTGSSGACKRGIASNTAPGAAFSPAVGWWYDWSNQGDASSVAFVPMIWGSGSLNAALPAGFKFLLTFNEPNFHAQSNLTAAQAAGYWPQIQTKAAGLPIVGPGMNFCGPDSACNGTSPYQYLKDFFAACTDCQVDYVAVHWYNCDLTSLKDYLEPGGSLEGFEQFGKPIWLTEFSCDTSASAADQEAYMRAAIPYLEGKSNVFRYSWFSAKNIPNAQLVNSDGSPTALGQVYISLPGACGP